jgi:hypothetical protein
MRIQMRHFEIKKKLSAHEKIRFKTEWHVLNQGPAALQVTHHICSLSH